MRRSKPFIIKGPVNEEQKDDLGFWGEVAGNIDHEFQILFDDLKSGVVEIALSQITSLTRSANDVITPLTPIGAIPYIKSATALDVIADIATGGALLSQGVGVVPKFGKVDLTTTITGVLPVANGGTGDATIPANGVLIGAGTSPITTTAVGASNTLLHGNTGAAPTYSAVVEGDITLADVTTGNVTSTAHGFAPKSPANATRYLNGAATPAYTQIALATDVTGTLADARLSANIPLLNAATNVFTGALSIGTTITSYNGVTTTGRGVPAVYGIDNRTGLTVADGAPITLYTTIATNNIFRVSANIFATAAVTGTATYTIAWTENATVQTMAVTATAINTLGTQSNLIRPDTGTTITAQLTGVFTGTFTVVGLVEQIA